MIVGKDFEPPGIKRDVTRDQPHQMENLDTEGTNRSAAVFQTEGSEEQSNELVEPLLPNGSGARPVFAILAHTLGDAGDIPKTRERSGDGAPRSKTGAQPKGDEEHKEVALVRGGRRARRNVLGVVAHLGSQQGFYA